MSNQPNPSIFLNEVAEQPRALRDLVAYYGGDERVRLARWAEMARPDSRIVFTGMGTSEFAAETIVHRLTSRSIDATTLDAGELLHYPRPVSDILVAISQSGESVETCKAMVAQRGRSSLVAVVNNEASSMVHAADLVLPLRAGHETAIATKTYVNTLGVLHLMAAVAEGAERLEDALRELESAADAMERYDSAAIERAAALLADTGTIHFVARGPAMVAAKQAALTFMEGTRCACTAFTGGAFRHGPFELAGASHRAVFLIPEGATGELLAGMAGEVAEKGGHVVVIASRPVALPAGNHAVLAVADLGEDLFPLAAATTQALLLDAVARQRGVEAGSFRYGSKITTRE